MIQFNWVVANLLPYVLLFYQHTWEYLYETETDSKSKKASTLDCLRDVSFFSVRSFKWYHGRLPETFASSGKQKKRKMNSKSEEDSRPTHYPRAGHFFLNFISWWTRWLGRSESRRLARRWLELLWRHPWSTKPHSFADRLLGRNKHCSFRENETHRRQTEPGHSRHEGADSSRWWRREGSIDRHVRLSSRTAIQRRSVQIRIFWIYLRGSVQFPSDRVFFYREWNCFKCRNCETEHSQNWFLRKFNKEMTCLGIASSEKKKPPLKATQFWSIRKELPPFHMRFE